MIKKDWSPQQLEAIARIKLWLLLRAQQVFYLAGYAGTGKTTLAAALGEELELYIAYATYTGKAASVMQKNGCRNAMTIDSLIYMPKIFYECVRKDENNLLSDPCDNPRLCVGDPPSPKQRCQFLRENFVGRARKEKLSKEGEPEPQLIVIDEVSMVGERMGRDLLWFNKPVLVLGDVAQLPPVEDEEGEGVGFFTKREPDYQLTELHRFALDSPICQLATRARREHYPLPWGNYRGKDYPDSLVVGDDFVADPKVLLNYDQIIVGTHELRHYINNAVRQALGFDRKQLPQLGEKLVCLKNRWKEIDSNDGKIERILNGTMWEVVVPQLFDVKDGFVDLGIIDENKRLCYVEAPLKGFTMRQGSGNSLPRDPFAFGYAITCHKAQGSQWKRVLVFDESHRFKGNRYKWLYTAITRAEQHVTIVCRGRR